MRSLPFIERCESLVKDDGSYYIFTGEPLFGDSIRTVDAWEGGPYSPVKPNGLWIACGRAWLDFIRGGGGHLTLQERYRNLYRVVLTSADSSGGGGKILHIRTKAALVAFNSAYSYMIDWAINHDGLKTNGKPVDFHGFRIIVGKKYRVKVIDWRRVQDEGGYGGIVICPWLGNLFRDKARFQRNYFWYGTWDVASGVIWDRRAIERLEWLAQQSG